MQDGDRLSARIAVAFADLVIRDGQTPSVLYLGKEMQQVLGVQPGDVWRGLPGKPHVLLQVRDLPHDPMGVRLD